MATNNGNGNGNGDRNGSGGDEVEFEKTFEKLEQIGDDDGLWIETDKDGSERIAYGEDVDEAVGNDDSGEDRNGNGNNNGSGNSRRDQ